MRRQQFGKRNRAQHRYHCEYCKVFVVGDRSDIKNHNATAIHKKNYQADLDAKHQAARKKKIESGYYDDKQELLQEYAQGQDKKYQRKSKYEQNKQRNYEQRQANNQKNSQDDNQLLNQAVSKDTMFGKGKKKGSKGRGKKVWDLVIDDVSGKIVFLNVLTGEKRDEKPYGLALSPEDEDLWQRSRENVSCEFYSIFSFIFFN